MATVPTWVCMANRCYMAKQAKSVPTAVVQAATVVKAGKATPGILAVKQGAKLRGARLAWYEVLCKYDGKPAAEFLAATAATPPSTPKSGIAEKPSGWLRYFTRSGIATVAVQQ